MAAKELKYTADAAEPLVIKLKYALCTYSVCCMPQRSEPTALRCAALHGRLSDRLRSESAGRYTAVESVSRRRLVPAGTVMLSLHCSPLQVRLH